MMVKYFLVALLSIWTTANEATADVQLRLWDKVITFKEDDRALLFVGYNVYRIPEEIESVPAIVDEIEVHFEFGAAGDLAKFQGSQLIERHIRVGIGKAQYANLSNCLQRDVNRRPHEASRSGLSDEDLEEYVRYTKEDYEYLNNCVAIVVRVGGDDLGSGLITKR